MTNESKRQLELHDLEKPLSAEEQKQTVGGASHHYVSRPKSSHQTVQHHPIPMSTHEKVLQHNKQHEHMIEKKGKNARTRGIQA